MQSKASVEHEPKSATAPPRQCEIRQKAWCIYQEGAEITDLQKTHNDHPGEHVWMIRDVYHPQSAIVVFEPEGCRRGFSDRVSAQRFDEGIQWHGRDWDQMRVRLRADGTCDLRLLVPVFDGSLLEWAFSVGRTLIAACPDEACTAIVPTPADVTDEYERRFRREGK